jgi:5'-3' exoribonuclease 2
MSSPASPIVDFYPPTFQLDPNGQKRKWQWIALLPFIDEARLKAAIAERVYPVLSLEEKARYTYKRD